MFFVSALPQRRSSLTFGLGITQSFNLRKKVCLEPVLVSILARFDFAQSLLILSEEPEHFSFVLSTVFGDALLED